MPAYGIESRKGQSIDATPTHNNLKNLKNAVVPHQAPLDLKAVHERERAREEESKRYGSAEMVVADGGGGANRATEQGVLTAAAAAAAAPAASGTFRPQNIWRDTELR